MHILRVVAGRGISLVVVGTGVSGLEVELSMALEAGSRRNLVAVGTGRVVAVVAHRTLLVEAGKYTSVLVTDKGIVGEVDSRRRCCQLVEFEDQVHGLP
mgnify:CR=1 FL=1